MRRGARLFGNTGHNPAYVLPTIMPDFAALCNNKGRHERPKKPKLEGN